MHSLGWWKRDEKGSVFSLGFELGLSVGCQCRCGAPQPFQDVCFFIEMRIIEVLVHIIVF